MRCFGGTVHCPAVAATPWALFPLSRSPPLSPLPQLELELASASSPAVDLSSCYSTTPLHRGSCIIALFSLSHATSSSPLLGLCLCLCDCVPPKPPAAVFRPAFRTLHAVPDLPISRIARPTALPGCDSPFVLEPFSLHFTFTCSTGRLHFLAAAEFSIDHVASSLPLIEFVFFS